MKRLIPLLLFATLIIGCRERPVSTAKYFAGEPVEHWLTEIKSPDAKKRQHAADVLGNVGPIDPGAIPALTAALKDKDAKVRLAAVLALSKIGPPAMSAAPDLEAAAKDTNPDVRKHTVDALRRIRS
jgi:HEAT repeat protein